MPFGYSLLVAERGQVAVVSRRVVLGGAGEPLRIEPACVVHGGSTIDRVVGHDQAQALAEQGLELVDYGDKLVSPAFCNAHTHLVLGCLRGLDMRAASRGNMVEEFFFHFEKKLSGQDIRAFARMGAYESLLAGVGLVWDHYYAGDQLAEALADVGLCGVVAPTLQDLHGPGVGVAEAQLQTTANIDDDARLAQAGIVAALGPHATDTVSAELFEQALKLAEARRLPLHAHLAQSLEEDQRARERHGCSPIEWLERIGLLDRAVPLVFAHCLFASRDDLQRLARATDLTLVFCPYSQLIFGFPAPVASWSALGLEWVVGTDCAANNDSMNVQKELRFAAGQGTIGATWSAEQDQLLASGGAAAVEALWQRRVELRASYETESSTARLLRRIWTGPGRIHPKLRAGVLEPGALASYVVWDLDHPALWPAHQPLHTLALADPCPAIWAMVVAGRSIGCAGDFHNSILHSAEYVTAREEAVARLARFKL